MADNNVPQSLAASPTNAAAAAVAPIAADDTAIDEGLGSDIASDTTSLRSSVLNFEIENGRRYHSYQQGAYAFPNDENELDRMDLEHHIFRMLLGDNHLTPLRKPQKILDLGTGTGIWAIEMADQFPSAHVLGIDLSPVQPQLLPPNCEFLVDDFEQEWMWQEGSFDLIHGRLMLASVTDYPKLFERAFRAVKPGGYLEIHEIDPTSYCDDGTLTAESTATQWGELFKEGCAKAGQAILPLEEHKPLMQEAGFTDVKELILIRPHNAWPKDKWLKRIGMVSIDHGLEFIWRMMTRLLVHASEPSGGSTCVHDRHLHESPRVEA